MGEPGEMEQGGAGDAGRNEVSTGSIGGEDSHRDVTCLPFQQHLKGTVGSGSISLRCGIVHYGDNEMGMGICSNMTD